MYNKLWTKILDSSIWLEPPHVRLVWITFLAMQDQDGTVALSGIGNVAARARVSEAEAEEAVRCLESPDARNPGQDHDGRRIERVPGVGWLVLNAEKYREIAKAESNRAATRDRVRRYREKKACNANVTDVTKCLTSVSVSGAVAVADKKKKKKEIAVVKPRRTVETWLTPFFQAWERAYGGKPAGGKLAAYLRPLYDQHGTNKVQYAWEAYLSQTDAQHASPSRFSETFGRWSGDVAPKEGNGYDREEKPRSILEKWGVVPSRSLPNAK